jgi:hypothetical protein
LPAALGWCACFACCAGVPDLPAVPVCLIARCNCLLLLLFLSQPLLPVTAAASLCFCLRRLHFFIFLTGWIIFFISFRM